MDHLETMVLQGLQALRGMLVVMVLQARKVYLVHLEQRVSLVLQERLVMTVSPGNQVRVPQERQEALDCPVVQEKMLMLDLCGMLLGMHRSLSIKSMRTSPTYPPM
jgi:hypothetical protein